MIPGTILLDGTSDIDGVNQIATLRAPVAPPRATFERLSIKHIPLPIVDPEGYRKTVAQITDNVDLATRYATWIKETIVAKSGPGESVLVVTHKAMIDQGRLPRKMPFADPLVIERRKVAFLVWALDRTSSSKPLRSSYVASFGGLIVSQWGMRWAWQTSPQVTATSGRCPT